MSEAKRYMVDGMFLDCTDNRHPPFAAACVNVVLASDYDALQQRCMELEAALTAYASEFACGQDGLPDVGSIHANIRATKAERDALRAEVERLKSENEDLVFALSDAEHRADHAGRNASAFEDRMGDLQVENGKLRDEIAQYRGIAYARVDECGELRAKIERLRNPTDDMLVAGQEVWARGRIGALEDCEEARAIYMAMVAEAMEHTP